MKKLAVLFLLFNVSLLYSNGVGIVDASNQLYLKLISSNVNVSVDNQVAVIKTTQVFRNDFDSDRIFKYAFPLPEEASAIGMRWFSNGEWHSAVISATAQDTTLPGGGTIHPNLTAYLGNTPLYFNFDNPLPKDSLITIELTYVELLKYKFGDVSFFYNNKYLLIQNSSVIEQYLEFNLSSSRTIESILLHEISPDSVINSGNSASIFKRISEQPANNNYKISYSLSLDQLGLFSFSTYQADSLVPDNHGRGFFAFVAEPDPTATTDVINKVFTLVVDRSGSMSGDKIIQAKNAANFIINNLNTGDKFNVVDFSSDVSSFRTGHVDFNEQTKTEALAYINTFQANGATNISGAFETAVSHFAVSNDSTANIIIFFTDGEATTGIVNTGELVDHVNNLISNTGTEITIFNFGIGSYVNEQLLTILASNNNGIAVFLKDDQLEEVITDFYLQIRNPVLLNSQIAFSLPIISEVFPNPLPNLYKGQQMIVSGRYSEGGIVQVTLSGKAFGNDVNYQYNLQLSDSSEESYQFLPKIWAKQKITNLLIQYYSMNSGTPEADTLKQRIIDISLAYGVITPFTSFTGNVTVAEELSENAENFIPEGFKLLGNYPNPFNPETNIRFSVGGDVYSFAVVRIYNTLGELIRTLFVKINGSGYYEVRWDGKNESNISVPSGSYIYIIDFGNVMLAQKMILLK